MTLSVTSVGESFLLLLSGPAVAYQYHLELCHLDEFELHETISTLSFRAGEEQLHIDFAEVAERNSDSIYLWTSSCAEPTKLSPVFRS